MLNDSLHFNDGMDFSLVQWRPLDYATHWGSPSALCPISSDEVDPLLMKVDAPTCFVPFCRAGNVPDPDLPSGGDGDDDFLRKVGRAGDLDSLAQSPLIVFDVDEHPPSTHEFEGDSGARRPILSTRD